MSTRNLLKFFYLLANSSRIFATELTLPRIEGEVKPIFNKNFMPIGQLSTIIREISNPLTFFILTNEQPTSQQCNVG